MTLGICRHYDAPLRIFVKSRSRDEREYLVELDAYEWNGKCSCESFTYRHEPFLVKGERGNHLHCWHIEQAILWLSNRLQESKKVTKRSDAQTAADYLAGKMDEFAPKQNEQNETTKAVKTVQGRPVEPGTMAMGQSENKDRKFTIANPEHEKGLKERQENEKALAEGIRKAKDAIVGIRQGAKGIFGKKSHVPDLPLATGDGDSPQGAPIRRPIFRR